MMNLLSVLYGQETRVQYQGAFYHVIVRGNQRQKVFLEDKDYRQYHRKRFEDDAEFAALIGRIVKTFPKGQRVKYKISEV